MGNVVDDIASEIGLSRANVYRFVPSRDAINESSYGRVINEVDEIAFAIARTNGPASEKLELTLSRSCNVWDNAAMGSFFSSLKTERTARKFYRTRDDAKADVFDYIERFYNPRRRHSTLGYLSPVEYEEQANLA
jgi:putative transposase